MLQSEIQVVMEMDHPCIVKFYQCVYDNMYINIVMELVNGMTLSDYIEQQPGKSVSEDKSQIILRQVLHAIKYFHSKGIVHRDLKTENIMVIGHDTGNINDLRIKLIDFGMSKFTKEDTKTINLNTFCGTLDFMAPEVITGKGYNNKCDLWSIGVIAYNMLAGFTPFIGKDMKQIQTKILTNHWDFDEPIWIDISKEAQDFISKLIDSEVADRYSSDQGLHDVWLSGPNSARINYKVHASVMLNLRECIEPHQMHFIFLALLVQFLDDDEIKLIRETFQSMDADNTGTIEIDELREAYLYIKNNADRI